MRPSLVQRFAQVTDGFNDSKVSDIWEIMKYMPSVKPSPRTQDPLRARCTQTQFIEQAKRYLENRYNLFMQTVIAEHLRDAQRGGIPSILNLVGSFVGLNRIRTVGLFIWSRGTRWPIFMFGQNSECKVVKLTGETGTDMKLIA
ncbi:hypothetical protein quinque_005010 [Culex quinquefasciatus]